MRLFSESTCSLCFCEWMTKGRDRVMQIWISDFYYYWAKTPRPPHPIHTHFFRTECLHSFRYSESARARARGICKHRAGCSPICIFNCILITLPWCLNLVHYLYTAPPFTLSFETIRITTMVNERLRMEEVRWQLWVNHVSNICLHMETCCSPERGRNISVEGRELKSESAKLLVHGLHPRSHISFRPKRPPEEETWVQAVPLQH